jgi:hypothetical protein
MRSQRPKKLSPVLPKVPEAEIITQGERLFTESS